MRKSAVALLLSLAALVSAQAATTSGPLTSDETWSGVVTLRGDVTVPAGLTLTIAPGTVVQSWDKVDRTGGGANPARIELIVAGTLLAVGEEASPITFTVTPAVPPALPGDWYGVRLQSTTNAPSVLRHCVFEFGINGLSVESAFPTVDACAMNNNAGSGLSVGLSGGGRLGLSRLVVQNNGQSGVIMFLASSSPGVVLTDCEILENPTGVHFPQWGEGGTIAVELNNCRIHHNHGHGILRTPGNVNGPSGTVTMHHTVVANNGAGGVFDGHPDRGIRCALDLVTADCQISGNGGTAILVRDLQLIRSVVDSNGDGVVLSGNGEIRDSTVSSNRGSGISSSFPGWLGQRQLVVDNCRVYGNTGAGIVADGVVPTIARTVSTGNSVGIRATTLAMQDCVISNNAIGLTFYQTHSQGVTGNCIKSNGIGIDFEYWLEQLATPNFTSNAILGSLSFDVRNRTRTSFRLPYNYWSTQTMQELQQPDVRNYTMIWDSADDPSLGQVLLEPYLETNPLAHPPTIATNTPADQTVAEGGTVTFSVTATSATPMTYQWRRGATDIAGATNSFHTIDHAQLADAGNDYCVVVANEDGNATSRQATLTVLLPPRIMRQPTSISVLAGNAAAFDVAAEGSEPLSYQWFFNQVALADGERFAGCQTPHLAVSTVSLADEGAYTVVVTNPAGNRTSDAALLTIPRPPNVSRQPTDVVVAVGGQATFRVEATGTEPLSYQWRFNGVAIRGATNSAYTVVAAAAEQAGSYSVVVSNVAGSRESEVAMLGLNGIDTCAVITLYGAVGAQYRVDWSEPMAPGTWQSLTNVTLPYSPFVIVDFGSTHSNKRFYRTELLR